MKFEVQVAGVGRSGNSNTNYSSVAKLAAFLFNNWRHPSNNSDYEVHADNVWSLDKPNNA